MVLQLFEYTIVRFETFKNKIPQIFAISPFLCDVFLNVQLFDNSNLYNYVLQNKSYFFF